MRRSAVFKIKELKKHESTGIISADGVVARIARRLAAHRHTACGGPRLGGCGELRRLVPRPSRRHGRQNGTRPRQPVVGDGAGAGQAQPRAARTLDGPDASRQRHLSAGRHHVASPLRRALHGARPLERRHTAPLAPRRLEVPPRHRSPRLRRRRGLPLLLPGASRRRVP